MSAFSLNNQPLSRIDKFKSGVIETASVLSLIVGYILLNPSASFATPEQINYKIEPNSKEMCPDPVQLKLLQEQIYAMKQSIAPQTKQLEELSAKIDKHYKDNENIYGPFRTMLEKYPWLNEISYTINSFGINNIRFRKDLDGKEKKPNLSDAEILKIVQEFDRLNTQTVRPFNSINPFENKEERLRERLSEAQGQIANLEFSLNLMKQSLKDGQCLSFESEFISPVSSSQTSDSQFPTNTNTPWKGELAQADRQTSLG